ncbi:MAG: ThuA domain-containing protein [Planctomycetota bacterium]
MQRLTFFALLFLFASSFALHVARAQDIDLKLRYQVPIAEESERFHRLLREETWQPSRTAVIVCDMWDSHHCVNAVRRVAQLTPRIDQFCRSLRGRGVTIIHAPSSCMKAYEKNLARNRTLAVPSAADYPEDIASWCDQVPSEEAAAYPVDQSEGGEDDDALDHRQWAERLAAIGRNPRSPWLAQVAGIFIDEKQDFISDSGKEIWNVLQSKEIQNVVLVGVHTNMCVLGRPFGLRRLAAAGKNVVLCRDLTDTMYNPEAWPYASHFTGTDLVVSHIEKYVCPTIASDQVLGSEPLRFAKDLRPRLLMIVAEDEYETEVTLPKFAAKHLSRSFSVSVVHGSEEERHRIPGIEHALSDADAILVSVRRRALDKANMLAIEQFVRSGKPVIGIRTASHAFSLRDKPTPQGKAVWKDFDAQVFGGSYAGHYGNNLVSTVSLAASSTSHLILDATDSQAIQPGGSLYRTAPLAEGALPLLMGTVENEPSHPLAWTFIRSDGGRSFYTSLGHKVDFEQPAFETLLAAGIHWACGLEPYSQSEIEKQNARYAAGSGKQR